MTKGRSSILAKAAYQRKQAYTPSQKLAYERCDCDSNNRVSDLLLDRIADEKFSGGYDIRRSRLCQKHFLAKSVNGKCIECEAEEA